MSNLTAIAIFEAPVSNDTRKMIRGCDDPSTLRAAMEMEEARTGGPRKSKVDMLRLRIDLIEAAAGLESMARKIRVDAAVPAPAAPVVETPPVVEELVQAVAPLPTPEAVAAPAAVEPTPEPAPEVQAVVTVVEAPITEEPRTSPVQNAATVLLQALAAGDAAGAIHAVGLIQNRGWTSQAVTGALLTAWASLPARARETAPSAPKAPRQPREAASTRPVVDNAAQRQPRASSDEGRARLQAAIDAGARGEDGTVTITAAQMEAAGFPPSWQKHATLWCKPTDQAGKHAFAIGFKPRLKKTGETFTLVLSPLPA